MNKLKKGMFAAQFPAGDKDPYWDDVLALIRCDGELVDLKGNCSLAEDVGLKRFTEGDTHLASYADLSPYIYARFLINSGFDPNADWTLEFTINAHEKTESQVSLYPSFLSVSSVAGRIIAIYGNSILDYALSVVFQTHEQKTISTRYIDKNQPTRYSIQQRNGYGIVHKDGIRIANTNITAPIITTTAYYLNIFTLARGVDRSGLGTIEEIRLTQAARYGLDDYSIEPVFIQDKLPVPVYPKDPLYSDVVSLLRVQQGYMYDTKLNTVSPNTTNSVKGYYLDAFNFTGQSSDVRNITLLEPLVDEEFTLEFTVKGEWVEGTKRVLSLFAVPSGLLLAVNLNQASMSVTVQGATSPSFLVEGGFDKVAIEWTRSAFVVYVNGAKVSTTPSSAVLDVGRIKFSDETNPFTGTLEEIRLTKGIRYAESYIPSDEVFPTRTGVKPEPEPVSKGHITFSSDAPFSIKFNQKSWDGVLEYSTDTVNWIEWDASEISSVNNEMFLRGLGNSVITGVNSASFGMKITSPTDSGVSCTGNIMTLLDHISPETAVMGALCFAMMFYGRTNLTTAPELPATQLATNCYAYMFRGCTSLTTAPELPATVLVDYCYYSMFYGTGIKISETQTGIYQEPWRIPSAGTIASVPSSWNSNMLYGTGGTFKGNPNINTTYYQVG